MYFEGKQVRQELKYAISEYEYACLRPRLAAAMTLDGNAATAGEYRITSLYFDNQQNDAFYEKESGDYRRAKYRIRIYNGENDMMRLELKEKFGQSTAKTSCRINPEIYQAVLQNRLLYEVVAEDQFLRLFFLKVKLERLRPCVIVDYIREPYVFQSCNVRITFDKRLRTVVNSVDMFASNQLYLTPSGYGDMILEVKYDDYLPEFIRRLLAMKQQQKLAISKYSICRSTKNALNWQEDVL